MAIIHFLVGLCLLYDLPLVSCKSSGCDITNPLQYQSFCSRSVVDRFSSTTGFSTELLNALDVWIYANMHHRGFTVDDTEWNFGQWNQVFNSEATPCAIPKKANKLSSDDIEKKFGNLWTGKPWPTVSKQIKRWIFSNCLNQKEREESEQNIRVKNMYIEKVELSLRRIFGQVLWSKLNSNMVKQVKDLIAWKFGMDFNIQKPYIAVHIRRGDKLKEYQDMPTVEEYLDVIEEYIDKVFVNDYDEKVIVVCTDTASIVNQIIERYPDAKIFALVPEEMDGYHQSKWNKMSNEDQEQGTILFIAELVLMQESSMLICHRTSNVCHFEEMIRASPTSLISKLENSFLIHHNREEERRKSIIPSLQKDILHPTHSPTSSPTQKKVTSISPTSRLRTRPKPTPHNIKKKINFPPNIFNEIKISKSKVNTSTRTFHIPPPTQWIPNTHVWRFNQSEMKFDLMLKEPLSDQP